VLLLTSSLRLPRKWLVVARPPPPQRGPRWSLARHSDRTAATRASPPQPRGACYRTRARPAHPEVRAKRASARRRRRPLAVCPPGFSGCAPERCSGGDAKPLSGDSDLSRRGVKRLDLRALSLRQSGGRRAGIEQADHPETRQQGSDGEQPYGLLVAISCWSNIPKRFAGRPISSPSGDSSPQGKRPPRFPVAARSPCSAAGSGRFTRMPVSTRSPVSRATSTYWLDQHQLDLRGEAKLRNALGLGRI
jgi:hypothetical protein